MFRPIVPLVARVTRALSLAPALLLSLTLAACAQLPADAPPIGQLRVLTPLEIPAGAASLRLQYGQPVAFNAVQEQDPFCVFELDTVSDWPQAVVPARFAILDIRRSVETFAGMPLMSAVFFQVGLGRGDGPSQLYYKTAFLLAPNPQGARSLTCMSNQYMPGIAIMRHLTLAEIRSALGQRMTLDLDGLY